MTEVIGDITPVFSTLFDVAGQAVNFITSNPLLLIPVGMMLVKLGFALFSKGKDAVKN